MTTSAEKISLMVGEFRELESLEGNEPIRCSRMHFRHWADKLEASIPSTSDPTRSVECTLTKRSIEAGSRSGSKPRWRNEDEGAAYEAAQDALEGVVNELRDRIRGLEEENDRLRLELLSPRRRDLMKPPVISFFGFQMESADVDG